MSDKDDETWFIVHKCGSYAVTYNITDATNMDRSDAEPEYDKNFYTIFVLKLWPHAIKDKQVVKDNPTGIVYVLAAKCFNTRKECVDWAKIQWAQRLDQEWYPELAGNVNKLLKNVKHCLPIVLH